MIIHSQTCIWDNYKELVIISHKSKASCRIYIYNDEPNIAYISNLYVDEKERNKGIGTELLKYCIDKAKQLNCSKIQLRSDNEDFVRKWYFRLGFKLIKSEIWLEKDIDDFYKVLS